MGKIDRWITFISQREYPSWLSVIALSLIKSFSYMGSCLQQKGSAKAMSGGKHGSSKLVELILNDCSIKATLDKWRTIIRPALRIIFGLSSTSVFMLPIQIFNLQLLLSHLSFWNSMRSPTPGTEFVGGKTCTGEYSHGGMSGLINVRLCMTF